MHVNAVNTLICIIGLCHLQVGFTAKAWVPGVVSLTTERKDHLCGGTLISRYWILTAAHCVHRKQIDSIKVFGLSYNETALDVARIVVHRNYVGAPDHAHNLALVQLKEASPIPSAVCLSPEPINVSSDRYFTYQWVHRNGDGYALNKVAFNLISHNDCAQMYGSSFITRDKTCVRAKENGTCDSDTGGPLLVTQPNTGPVPLVGVASFMVYCESAIPVIYGNVSVYLEWVQKTIGEEALKYCDQSILGSIQGNKGANEGLEGEGEVEVDEDADSDERDEEEEEEEEEEKKSRV